MEDGSQLKFLIMRGVVLVVLIAGSLLGQSSKDVEVRGQYRNLGGFAYRVVVPDGTVAYPSFDSGHGITVDLVPNGGDRISIEGYLCEYQGARDIPDSTVENIKRKASSIETPQFRSVVLGRLPAVELVLRYRDKETNAARVCRSVSAIRPGKTFNVRGEHPRHFGIAYEITLDTSNERLASGTVIFESMVRSFRLDRLPRF
jgi:hypothetical protein